MNIKFFFDGAVRQSTKGADMGIGVAVFVDSIFEPELSHYNVVAGFPESSCHVAEWLACIEAMELAAFYAEKGDVVEIYSDSQIISYQFNGKYRINQPLFKLYYAKAKQQAAKIGIEEINWVRRQFNKEADKLSKLGLKQIP